MKRTKSLNNLRAIAFLQSGAARLLQEAAQMPGKCNLFHSQIRGELITVDTKWRGEKKKISNWISAISRNFTAPRRHKWGIRYLQMSLNVVGCLILQCSSTYILQRWRSCSPTCFGWGVFSFFTHFSILPGCTANWSSQISSLHVDIQTSVTLSLSPAHGGAPPGPPYITALKIF